MPEITPEERQALKAALENDKAISRQSSIDPNYPEAGVVATHELLFAVRQHLGGLLAHLESVERERDHWRAQYEVAYAVAQNMADRLNESETLGRALTQEGANDGD